MRSVCRFPKASADDQVLWIQAERIILSCLWGLSLVEDSVNASTNVLQGYFLMDFRGKFIFSWQQPRKSNFEHRSYAPQLYLDILTAFRSFHGCKMEIVLPPLIVNLDEKVIGHTNSLFDVSRP